VIFVVVIDLNDTFTILNEGGFEDDVQDVVNDTM